MDGSNLYMHIHKVLHLFTGPGGSAPFKKETFFLNLNNNQWTQGPDLSNAADLPSCSLITNSDGSKEVVVVGGYNGNPGATCGRLNTVDIIDPVTNTKRSGTKNYPYMRFAVIRS